MTEEDWGDHFLLCFGVQHGTFESKNIRAPKENAFMDLRPPFLNFLDQLVQLRKSVSLKSVFFRFIEQS